jgi:Zn-dependent protease
MDAVATERPSLARQAWNFVEHYLEMCIAMCAVGTPAVLLAFAWGPSAIGYADPRERYLELSVLTIAVIYALPMSAWMRFRGMDWRPILEMGGATIAVGLALIATVWLGVLSPTGLRGFAGPAFCTPACVVMFLVMLPRLDMYTGRTGHAMGRRAHAAHAM